jgi:hypothetical protein
MKNTIHALSVAILVFGLNNAWAADPAEKPAMGNMNQGGMHMDQMHKHMNEMHKSNGMGDSTKGNMKCDMKSNSKCDAKSMNSNGKPAGDKSKTPTSADEHSAHHE